MSPTGPQNKREALQEHNEKFSNSSSSVKRDENGGKPEARTVSTLNGDIPFLDPIM